MASADGQQQGGDAAQCEADDGGRVGHDEFGRHDGQVAFAEAGEGGSHGDQCADESAGGAEAQGEPEFVQAVVDPLTMELQKALNIRIIMRLSE